MTASRPGSRAAPAAYAAAGEVPHFANEAAMPTNRSGRMGEMSPVRSSTFKAAAPSPATVVTASRSTAPDRMRGASSVHRRIKRADRDGGQRPPLPSQHRRPEPFRILAERVVGKSIDDVPGAFGDLAVSVRDLRVRRRAAPDRGEVDGDE